MKWHRIHDGLWLFPDSCNVYAVEAPEGMVLVNAGTATWLQHQDDLPKPVSALCCTHFFRDHSAGAAEAARRGIAIYAPYWEQEQFADPLGLFQRRETSIVGENMWDLYSPIEPIPVTGWLRDWGTLKLAGLEFCVLPSPGVTVGAITLLCDLRGQTVAFCGELLHSPGKVPRLAPLQYDYNDLRGAISAVYSIRLLRAQKPHALLPSLGNPMLDEADSALAATDATLRHALSVRPGLQAELDQFDLDPLIKITDHIWQSTYGGGCTWFIISKSGKAMAIDYGYHTVHVHWPSYSLPRNQRPIPHGLEGLKKMGIDRVDLVIPTHYHFDHVGGIPTLQRLYGTRCWAGENLAPILAAPADYSASCSWPEPIQVEPQPLGVPLQWEEYAITLEPISGHTRWSNLVFLEIDGRRVAATGDQYLWQKFSGEYRPPTEYDGSPYYTNWVYCNGATLDSLQDSCQRLRRYRPDLILPGHGHAYFTNEAFFDAIRRYAEDYREIHRRAMPLDEKDVHFDLDSRAAWIEPYRAHVATGSSEPLTLRFRVCLRNPFPRPVELRACLMGPSGWIGTPVVVSAEARADKPAELRITLPAGTICRRQPIALELSAGERLFGQVGQALVTVGYPIF